VVNVGIQYRQLPQLRLLPESDLLPGPAGLLRSICDFELLRAVMPLRRAGPARTENVLSHGHTTELGPEGVLAAVMHWW
jgi:hypothetical protein